MEQKLQALSKRQEFCIYVDLLDGLVACFHLKLTRGAFRR